MKIAVRIHDGPLPASRQAGSGDDESGAAGALVTFEGVVRALEKGRPIVALNYEVYEPMATRMLQHLAEEVQRSCDLIALSVAHSRGRVPVGRCAFRLQVASAHRAEALRALAEFIDAVKRDVPIWKTAVYKDPIGKNMSAGGFPDDKPASEGP